MNDTTTIEINGNKFDVDLRTAKRVSTLRVGDRVKVLVKNYSDYAVYPGTVIGFEPFSKLPTIIIAYLTTDYASCGLKFLHFNAETKDTEVIAAIDNDQLDINRNDVITRMDREIAKAELALEEAKQKKQFFIDNFRAYFKYAVVAGE